MKLIGIHSLTNNYIWILHNNIQCIIIDPGEHEPVFQILQNLKITPVAIFLTHYHNDHTQGVPELLKYYKIQIYGPKKTQKNIDKIIIVNEKNIINVLNLKFKIISLPGHTLEHIGFYSHPWLFSGDTIFSSGCGKVYTGAEKKMYKSLQKIKKLNKDTLICSAHEYTLSNIKFALTIVPKDRYLILYKKYIEKKRNKKQLNIPSTLKNELKINIFLRCNEIALKNALGLSSNEEEWKVFSKLRKRKDNYLL